MTTHLSGEALALHIQPAIADSVVRWDQDNLWIRPETWLEVAPPLSMGA